MDVRVADAGDLGRLADLAAAFRDHLGAQRPDDAELRATLPQLLADEAAELCLALSREARPIGYSSCRFFRSLWAPGWEAHLEDLFVVEDARGQGVGRRLASFAIERAEARGVVSIGLHTNERNRAAQAFYQRLGFSPAGERRWGDGREVYWVREIAPGG